MSEQQNNRLIVSTSPHINDSVTTQRIMRDVIYALVPAMMVSAYVFGMDAVKLLVFCAAVSALTEGLYRRLMHKEQTVQDLSAVLTGILIAMNVPSTLPLWEAAVGCIFAILVVKQLFGGLGQNFVNPALAGRVFLLVSFATPMATWPSISVGAARVAANFPRAGAALDAVTGATPLALWSDGKLAAAPSNMNLFLGFTAGSLGEISALALLLGGIYLVIRKVISPAIPVSYMATVAVFALLVGEDPIFHLCAGGLMLGAIFMATDYVTSPITTEGRIIFGIGCGILTMVIRLYGSYPEGVSFAILLMNIVTPHIDNLTRKGLYGGKAGQRANDAWAKGGEAK